MLDLSKLSFRTFKSKNGRNMCSATVPSDATVGELRDALDAVVEYSGVKYQLFTVSEYRGRIQLVGIEPQS